MSRLKVKPPFEHLHDDPRWRQMADKVGFQRKSERPLLAVSCQSRIFDNQQAGTLS